MTIGDDVENVNEVLCQFVAVSRQHATQYIGKERSRQGASRHSIRHELPCHIDLHCGITGSVAFKPYLCHEYNKSQKKGSDVSHALQSKNALRAQIFEKLHHS